MPIPFPPGGPQVQSALQNPAQFPDQKLQQYAQGQQPTGQVPPPLAANELTIRNAQRQAAARQTAMQNNPANSPTIFQQKDMELQQKAQQLAAMGQQIQQKEQQLGVLGALMAKKAQDMQARESMGVANLPIRPDMFTAMNGGIVFSGGGGVEGYARRGLVQDLGMISPLREDRMAEGFTEPGVMDMVGSEELPEDDSLKTSINNIRNKLAQYETALRGTNLSPEKKAELLKAAEDKLTGQYSKYKQGLASLDAETKAALEGEAPTFQQRLGKGLARLPTDLRGVRLGGALAALGAGAAETDAEYAKRKREAAQYMADARRKGLAADLAEERGRPELARKLIAGEEADLTKAADIESKIAKAGIDVETGIAGLESKSALQEARLEAAKATAQRSAELREQKLRIDEQKLKIDEALAQGRISALQANAATAALNQQMRALELENRNLQTQIQLGNVRSQVQDRVNKALENDSAYLRISNSIDKLMRKDKLSKEEDARLDLLLEQRNQIVNAKREEYGVNTLPSSGTMPSQAAKALPNKVSVGGQSFNRPSNFTDEQWRKYIKDTGAKAE